MWSGFDFVKMDNDGVNVLYRVLEGSADFVDESYR